VLEKLTILQDSTVSNMTHGQWQRTLGPKVTGTLNLHSVFDEPLDFFILLSSVSGIIGSHGQGNYSAGSTFQDAFARWLSSKNHPVRTIDLCVVGSEGYAAENVAAAKHAIRYGAGTISIEEVFALVDHAISHPFAGDSRKAQVLVGITPANPASGSEESAAQRPDPRLSHLWNTSSRQSTTNVGTSEVDLCAALQATTTQDLAIQTVQSALIEKLSRLVGVAAEEINHGQTVSSYGMDSLIAVELRNWVLKQLESYVETLELMSPFLIRDLARLMAERSRLVPAGLFSKED
jgi:KR domain/Phosphopantetheine attachment site